ncbi:MAG: DNA polymerase I, partial [Candidatus Sungbacteria bacterium]|nr:DNA polymerase I [Candidatus Sungbacteria bacterium]
AAVSERLREGEEEAKFSKALATIKMDVPLKFELASLASRGTDSALSEAARQLFLKFGFHSLLKRFSAESSAKPMQETLDIQSSQETVALRNIDAPADFKKYSSEFVAGDIGIILEGGRLFVVPHKGKTVFRLGENIFSERVVRDFFRSKQNIFVHDGKAILHFLRKRDIVAGAFNFDIALASYVAGGTSRDFSYLAVASRELGRLVSPKAEEEFTHFFEIVESLEGKLAQGKLKKVLAEIELPLTPILAEMEKRGILLDRELLKNLSGRVNKELRALTKQIYERAGESFNINSSQQLSRILFEKLNVKTHGLRKTAKGGVISTGATELEKLRDAHPIIKNVLDYRELTKLKTTYIDTLPTLVNPRTGRIHTTFNQTGTSTGRLSSSNPNLQNIPILSGYGREIRKAFVAEKGFLFVSFDYSQIELRVAAHLADDKKMIEAFQEGLDIHKMTAAEVYNVPLDKVTPELRRAAKTLNFGVLYGMGTQAFSESTGLSREEARKFIDEYFRDFAGIRKYIEETKHFAEERGFAETLFGRRRYIPEIHSPNWQMKREAERMAINAPIQGSAADLVKMAMIKVDEWVKREGLESGVRMLLQVHDELLFEIKKEKLKEIAPQIKEIMEGAAKLKTPLVVDVKFGPNWGKQESYA